MAGTSKKKGAKALVDVKTQQQVGAGVDEAAAARMKQASQREGDDPAHDSPKRHGDKLEHARDAAAGRKP